MIDKMLADVNSLLEPYHFCEWHEVECWTKNRGAHTVDGTVNYGHE